MGKERFAALWILALLFLLLLFFFQWFEGRKIRAEIADESNALKINKAEIDRLNRELTSRSADDCKVSREWYGFSCQEIKTGKIYKIIM